MPKTYEDMIRAMTVLSNDGKDVNRVVLTDESISTFLTDGKFHEGVAEKHDQLGEFSIPIEEGDGMFEVVCQDKA
jgi:hypothetical protein